MVHEDFLLFKSLNDMEMATFLIAYQLSGKVIDQERSFGMYHVGGNLEVFEEPEKLFENVFFLSHTLNHVFLVHRP